MPFFGNLEFIDADSYTPGDTNSKKKKSVYEYVNDHSRS